MASVEDAGSPKEGATKIQKMYNVYGECLSSGIQTSLHWGGKCCPPWSEYFILVMKPQGGILALPKDGGYYPTEVEEIPWHFTAEVTRPGL